MTWWTLEPRPGDRSATLTVLGQIDADADPLVDALAGLDVDEIVVRIDSGGGNAASGLKVFQALMLHPATVVAHLGRRVNSAATLVAVGADRRIANWQTDVLVHDAQPGPDDPDTAQDLEPLNALVAATLAERTCHRDDGSPGAWEWRVGRWRQMMASEATLSASECVWWGLCDEIADGWTGPRFDGKDPTDDELDEIARTVVKTVLETVAGAVQ